MIFKTEICFIFKNIILTIISVGSLVFPNLNTLNDVRNLVFLNLNTLNDVRSLVFLDCP